MVDAKFERNFHRWAETFYLQKILTFTGCDAVFDVGAATGQYGQRLREDVGFDGWIFSFEPIPDQVAALRNRAIEDGRWEIFETALSEVNGTRTLNVTQGKQFSSFGVPRQGYGDLFKQQNETEYTLQVSTRRLDNAFWEISRKCSFEQPLLKMDTQGCDVEVVRGGLSVIRHFVGIQSELSVVPIYDHSIDFRVALAFYQQLGFVLTGLFPSNRGHFPWLIDIDCVMTRQDLC